MGDGEKLLTHLHSALKVLSGLDIFPRVPKNKLNFVDQCYWPFYLFFFFAFTDGDYSIFSSSACVC